MKAPTPAVVGPTCEAIVRSDLPLLPDERQTIVVEFVGRRLLDLPTHMRYGVALIAFVIDGVRRSMGDDRLIALSRRPLPLIGEYFRLIRSLSFAYVWETWPDTQPDGGIA
jgi:hypothetical protein